VESIGGRCALATTPPSFVNLGLRLDVSVHALRIGAALAKGHHTDGVSCRQAVGELESRKSSILYECVRRRVFCRRDRD
jgi:hypothetical protein